MNIDDIQITLTRLKGLYTGYILNYKISFSINKEFTTYISFVYKFKIVNPLYY